MGKKSGKAGKAVSPAAPTKPEDADIDDPGKVDEIKAEQIKTKSGKYGSEKVKPFKPPQDEEEQETKKSWIEIELVNDIDEPVPGEVYEIELPDGSVASGTTDENGFARVEGFESGTCKIKFPNLDKEAWEPY